jgi:hypothetical protein
METYGEWDLSRREVARRLGIPPGDVERMVLTGRISHVRRGCIDWYSRVDVDRLDRARRGSESERKWKK